MTPAKEAKAAFDDGLKSSDNPYVINTGAWCEWAKEFGSWNDDYMDKASEDELPSFGFWAILEDHNLNEEMFGIGVVNGINAGVLEQIHSELKDCVFDSFDVESEFPPNCAIDFVARNVTHQDGQMSFPETGQWDFPPHFEMEISIVKVETLSNDA